MNEKLFNYAGTSYHKSSDLKVRFATDIVSRVKVFAKGGDQSDLNYYELPHPMNKREACEYLLSDVELSEEQRFAVTARLADLKKIERRAARQRGEVKVVKSAEELLSAISKREKIAV